MNMNEERYEAIGATVVTAVALIVGCVLVVTGHEEQGWYVLTLGPVGAHVGPAFARVFRRGGTK